MAIVTIQYLNNNLLKNYEDFLGKSNMYIEKIYRCTFKNVCFIVNYTTINFYEYLNMRR